ncbi:YjbH domain-containing protein [Alphaproteobacteria bacterium KMM 3653]|uniref:YjbH domain-containing protein n=1 Tax=Harenicola maris TaxID=2841044 RepID=A0AAP2CV48_9RHOB|nr:YjbH domain-containing protein [Harenicola maris]
MISLATIGLSASWATSSRSETLGFYGTPGLIDMPTARPLDDGFLALSYGQFASTARNTLTFQITPRLTGTFRYAVIDKLDSPDGTRYDRSFDVSYLLWEEGRYNPAIAIGLRDLGGTGVYSSEYIVATKNFGKLSGTLGLGWGRLASRNPFSNPFSFVSEKFENRPSALGGTTGEFDTGSWFRGDAALFGGLSYAVSDRTSIAVEYSSDTYELETQFGGQEPVKSPFNFGITHRFANGVTASGYYLYGTDLGFMLSYQLDPSRPRLNGGRDPVAPPLAPRNAAASLSWNANGAEGQLEQALEQRLEDQGLILSALALSGQSAAVTVENRLWPAEAQAAGRAARIMANTLPPHVETFTIYFEANGVALSSVTVHRSDLHELEFALEGDWNMRVRSIHGDGYNGAPARPVPDAYPNFEYAIGPYMAVALFDPDAPLRYDIGVQALASYEPTAGLIFSGGLRYPLVSTIDDAIRRSNSTLPRVRSDGFEYASQSDLEVNHLTAEYFFRPAPDMFGRVTAGYLESMFGGVSAEVLWAPVDSRLALGAEINHVYQRNYDMLFGFQDYNVTTGHVSAYYDIGNGFHGQLDVGRYLAGDYGGTFTLTRQFDSGFRLGAFATLTNVSSEEFGEGSFDKGIFFDAPVTFFTGRATRNRLQRVIRPVDRDGGARLRVRNRLYDMTYDYRAGELADGWGPFFR